MEHQAEYLRQSAMPGDMDMDAHMRMMERRRIATLWCHFTNMMLGLWLITAPFIFGYLEVRPEAFDLQRLAAERDLPELATRNLLMTWSDVLSGTLVVLFSVLSLARRSWAQWANAATGLWLMFAPLLFWAPSPAAYGNGTLIGGLVIAFSVLVPMMPGMSMPGMMQKASLPPGWDYNPSTWLQRIPIAILALLGIFIARYLSGYQMGHISDVWEPFFGGEPNGTETIITSKMSTAWPVPDAGLGAMAYMIELLMAVMGDARRWRTMPWMVAAFGVVVVPLGAVSIFFIISQPIFIGTWCSLCLLQALAMLIMMPYALDEIVAMGQFLADARRRGKPFWRTFFMGDAMDGARQDEEPEFADGPGPMTWRAVRGVNLPWGLLLASVIGVWLMFTRLIYGTEGAMANSDHLMGSMIITISVLAMAEVARPLRFVNVLFGLWLMAAPWILSGASGAAAVGSVVAGLLVVVLSVPRGPIRYRYAGWNRYLV